MVRLFGMYDLFCLFKKKSLLFYSIHSFMRTNLSKCKKCQGEIANEWQSDSLSVRVSERARKSRFDYLKKQEEQEEKKTGRTVVVVLFSSSLLFLCYLMKKKCKRHWKWYWLLFKNFVWFLFFFLFFLFSLFIGLIGFFLLLIHLT
jgi:hypothetical protein